MNLLNLFIRKYTAKNLMNFQSLHNLADKGSENTQSPPCTREELHKELLKTETVNVKLEIDKLRLQKEKLEKKFKNLTLN